MGAWLDSRNGCRIALPVSAAGQTLVKPCCYQLEVQTSADQGAGTYADVLLQLHGTEGSTDVLLLAQGSLFCVRPPGSNTGSKSNTQSKRLFGDGALDVFHIGCLPDVGQFTHVLVALAPGQGTQEGEWQDGR